MSRVDSGGRHPAGRERRKFMAPLASQRRSPMHLRKIPAGGRDTCARPPGLRRGAKSETRGEGAGPPRTRFHPIGVRIPRGLLDARVLLRLPTLRKPPITLKGSGTESYDEFGNLKMGHPCRLNDVRHSARGGSGNQRRRHLVERRHRGRHAEQDADLLDGGPTKIGYRPARHQSPAPFGRSEGTLLTLTTQDEAGKPLSVANREGARRPELTGLVSRPRSPVTLGRRLIRDAAPAECNRTSGTRH